MQQLPLKLHERHIQIAANILTKNNNTQQCKQVYAHCKKYIYINIKFCEMKIRND